MASEATVGRVKDLAADAVRDPIDGLIERRDWGSINFQNARTSLESIFSLSNHLLVLPIELVPENQLNQFIGGLQAVSQSLEAIRKFDLATANPVAQRDSIVSQLQSTADNFLVTVQSWIPFLAYQRGDIQRNIESLNSSVGAAKKIHEDALHDAAGAKSRLDEIIYAAQEASATVGVAHFTSDFAGQASTNDGEAKAWLYGAASFATATCIAAIVSFFVPLPSNASNAVIFQFMTSKLVLLGVLIGATAWCARNYRALKHQAATNRHRSNALKSFQAFVKATGDEATRNAVLLETTRSIFAIAPSGYLEGGDGAADTGSKVLEIIKGVTKGGDK